MISIMIADDHPLVLEGLEKTLSGIEGLHIIGVYQNTAQLQEGLKHFQPDILLMDLHFPDGNADELLPVLFGNYPALQVIILSADESPRRIREMLQSGCRGYLLKSSTRRDSLRSAIRSVYEGGTYIDEAVRNELLSEMLLSRRKEKKVRTQITQREQEILQLIAERKTNQEIADTLFISLRTAETHRYNLYQKLNVKNTEQLLKTAWEMNLIAHL